MKRKLAVLLSATLIITLSAGLVSADARRILRPGDHVIDVKRLADSVKETAQRAQEYQNQLDKYKDMLILYSGLPELNQKVNEAVQAMQTQLSGASLVLKQNLSLDDSILRKRPTANETYQPTHIREYQQSLLNEQQLANKEALTVYQRTLQQAQDREEAIANIAATATDGIVGTRQKTAAMAALQSLHETDEARAAGAALINQIETDEAQYADMRRQQEETKLGQFYLYDPYNPSDYDEDHAPQTDNFGFLSTRDTGT